MDFIKKLLEKKVVEYVVVAQEEHHQTEGKHLHVFVMTKCMIRTQKCRFFDWQGLHPNIQGVLKRDVENIVNYVKKTQNWIEDGDNPIVVRKLNTKEKNKMIVENPIDKLVEDGIIAMQTVPTIVKAKNIMNLTRHVEDLPFRYSYRNLWIWGPTGIGKSLWVRNNVVADKLFWKPLNKWWDGYNDEDVVVLDDIDRSHGFLGYYLKIWADRYVFTGEVKGSSVKLRPKSIIVTSQYRPEDIFGKETRDGWIPEEPAVDAIRRRMFVVTVDQGQLRSELLDQPFEWNEPLAEEPPDDSLVSGLVDP